MRENTRLHEAVESAISLLSEGWDISPDSNAFQRVENELYWLLSGNSDPIDDALDRLLDNPVSVSLVLDLHDLVADEATLSNQEKTKLHFAINLKVSKV